MVGQLWLTNCRGIENYQKVLYHWTISKIFCRIIHDTFPVGQYQANGQSKFFPFYFLTEHGTMYFVQYAGKTFFNNSQQTTDATSQWLQDGSGQKIKVDKIKVKFESFLHLELYAKIVRY